MEDAYSQVEEHIVHCGTVIALPELIEPDVPCLKPLPIWGKAVLRLLHDAAVTVQSYDPEVRVTP